MKIIGNSDSSCRLVFLHGWGTDSSSLYPLASLFASDYEVCLTDLAGFGKAPPPTEAWGTEEYAKSVERMIAELPKKTTIVVGHSFGGRLCIRLGHSPLVQGIILIGGAGLPYRHSVGFKIKAFVMKYLAKIYRKIPFLPPLNLGSADYRAAKGIMRQVFVKTVSENLTETARQVSVPALLIYGKEDTAAPVYFGEIYHREIPDSDLKVMDFQDHYSLLFDGKQQTFYHMKHFLSERNFK